MTDFKGVAHLLNANSQGAACCVVEIGDWDMDTTASVAIAHGLTLSKIRSVSALIRNDAGTVLYPLIGHDGAAAAAMIETIDATNINIIRAAGGDFDGADFDSTSYNRGWIKIDYEF